MNLKSRAGAKEKSTTKDATGAKSNNPLAKLAEYLKKMNSERRKTLQKLDEGAESENEHVNLPEAVVEQVVNPEREAEMFTTFQKHQLDWDDIEARITMICRELMDGIKLLATNVNV